MRETGQACRTWWSAFVDWTKAWLPPARVHARPRRACTSVKERRQACVWGRPMRDWCDTNYREEWICVDGPAKECHRLTPGENRSRGLRARYRDLDPCIRTFVVDWNESNSFDYNNFFSVSSLVSSKNFWNFVIDNLNCTLEIVNGVLLNIKFCQLSNFYLFIFYLSDVKW